LGHTKLWRNSAKVDYLLFHFAAKGNNHPTHTTKPNDYLLFKHRPFTLHTTLPPGPFRVLGILIGRFFVSVIQSSSAGGSSTLGTRPPVFIEIRVRMMRVRKNDGL
jgi:hypothetical protein